MINVVRGNDFSLSIPMFKVIYVDGSEVQEPFDIERYLPKIYLVDKDGIKTICEYTYQDNIAYISVTPEMLLLGVYDIEITSDQEFNIRSKETAQINVVDSNDEIKDGTNYTLDSHIFATVGNNNYNILLNLPKINDVEVKGEKTLDDYGILPTGNYALKSEIPSLDGYATERYVDNKAAAITLYLKDELGSKQDTLIPGVGIVIEGNTISCTLGASLFEVVQTLPTLNISENKIYLVPDMSGTEVNSYQEYIWINNKWELIGEATVHIDTDLFATKEMLLQTNDSITALQSIQPIICTQSEYNQWLSGGLIKENVIYIIK